MHIQKTFHQLFFVTGTPETGIARYEETTWEFVLFSLIRRILLIYNNVYMCSGVYWLQLTLYAESIGFLFSIVLHCVLLFLVSEKTKEQFGNYKYLMICFSIFGSFYSFCNFLNRPKVHMTETSFIIFSVLDYTMFAKHVAEISITVYCSCYAMMIGILAVQFFYRYMSVTRPMGLRMFSGPKMIGWVVSILLYALAWGLISYFLDGPTESKDQELEMKFNESYCLLPGDYAYVGPQYFTVDAEGSLTYHFPSCIGIFLLVLLLSVSVSSVVFFGVSTYHRLEGLHLNSVLFKDLQKQLFRTLVFQTIIPTLFMYLPVSVMFLMPWLGLPLDESANVIAILLAVYPSLEPIVAMILIVDIRKRIAAGFRCKCFSARAH